MVNAKLINIVSCFRLIILIIVVFTISSSAGTWKFGGKVSVQSDGEQNDLVSALTAEYQILNALAWRTDLEIIIEEINSNKSGLSLAIPTNLLWYPLQRKFQVDPYIGPGLVYTFKIPNQYSLGMNILSGVTFSLPDKPNVGIEIKYSVSKFTSWAQSDKFSISLTGNWEIEF